MKHFTYTALLISMFWATMASAQSVDSAQPMKVRVTGTMLPFEEQQRDDRGHCDDLRPGQALVLSSGQS